MCNYVCTDTNIYSQQVHCGYLDPVLVVCPTLDSASVEADRTFDSVSIV